MEAQGQVFSLLKTDFPVPIPRLASGIPALDRFVGGGVRPGEVWEWGLPHGGDGCRVILQFVVQQLQLEPDALVLWACGEEDRTIHAPAWEAQGVDLNRVFFAYTADPVRHLRAAFLEPLFAMVVLDAPRPLSTDAMAFVAHQARRHKQITFLLTRAWLSPRRGNVWARVRLNCAAKSDRGSYQVTAVRGLPKPRGQFYLEA